MTPSNSTEVVQPTLTVEQYQKLLDMLASSGSSSQTQDVSKDTSPDTHNNACFAGKFCLSAQYKSGWVLDSGALNTFAMIFLYFNLMK